MGKYDYFINTVLTTTRLRITTIVIVSTRFTNDALNRFIVECLHCLPMTFFFVLVVQQLDVAIGLLDSQVHHSDYQLGWSQLPYC